MINEQQIEQTSIEENYSKYTYTRGEKRRPDGSFGVTISRNYPKIQRNDLCPCGSEKKFKNCCIKLDLF